MYNVLVYAVGLLVQEARSVYYLGIENYASNTYNLLNWLILALYFASFSSRVIAERGLRATEAHTHATELGWEVLRMGNLSAFKPFVESLKKQDNFSDFGKDDQLFYYLEACMHTDLAIHGPFEIQISL